MKPQKQKIKITLCGYYGKGNLGDESILSSILRAIHEIFENRAQICIINSKNPIEIAQMLSNTDIFIFGGGSLLQNSTSTASLFYYLAVINTANLLAKKKIMLANGIGPINGDILPRQVLMNLVAQATNTFDIISVRDTDSQALLKKLLPHRKIHYLPDPALAIFSKNTPKLNQQLINLHHASLETPYFAYIPCTHGLENARVSPSQLSNALENIEKSLNLSAKVCILNTREDSKIAKSLPNFNFFAPQTPEHLTALLKNAEFVLTQRYHGALFATCSEKPILAISRDPKMHSLCKDFHLYKALPPTIFLNHTELNFELNNAILHHQTHPDTIKRNAEQKADQADIMLHQILDKISKQIQKTKTTD